MSDGSTWTHLERIRLGHYRVTNDRGGELVVGDGSDDDFTPVELLLAALSACSALDVDHIVSRRAESTAFRVGASGRKVSDPRGNHLADVSVHFDLRFGEDATDADAVVQRSIEQSRDRLCTVGRTVQRATPVTMSRVLPPAATS